MNRHRYYEDYYQRQVGGVLPVFAGSRVQRGHGLGSRFGGLLRSAAPLIKRGAVALGKRALKTGLRVADDVMSGQSVKDSAKRRAKEAGTDFINSLLGGAGSPPGIRASNARRKRRIKLKTPTPSSSLSKKRRRRKTHGDIFGD